MERNLQAHRRSEAIEIIYKNFKYGEMYFFRDLSNAQIQEDLARDVRYR